MTKTEVPDMTRGARLPAVLLIGLILTTGPPAAPAASTPEEVLSAFVAGFNDRNAARAAAVFGVDGELMLPDEPPATGRAAVLATLDAQFRVTRMIDLLSVTVTRAGRQAVAAGRLTMSTRTPVHGADIRSGSYLAVLRQAAGGWEITHLMFTLPLRPDFVG
ncbi:MAG: DUF4440 domain-containing protein [Vicinamibacterales bacterium]